MLAQLWGAWTLWCCGQLPGQNPQGSCSRDKGMGPGAYLSKSRPDESCPPTHGCRELGPPRGWGVRRWVGDRGTVSWLQGATLPAWGCPWLPTPLFHLWKVCPSLPSSDPSCPSQLPLGGAYGPGSPCNPLLRVSSWLTAPGALSTSPSVYIPLLIFL